MTLIDLINNIPDAIRLVLFPALRLLAAVMGWQLWEDGSVTP